MRIKEYNEILTTDCAFSEQCYFEVLTMHSMYAFFCDIKRIIP